MKKDKLQKGGKMTALRDVKGLPDNYWADDEHKRLSLAADDEWQKAKKSGLDLDYARAHKLTDKLSEYLLNLEGY